MGAGAFAAVVGSSAATIAALGRMSVEEMQRYGHSKREASGTIASAGTLGILIPPSIALVVYGLMSGESIAKLLVAGIIPGIISIFWYIALIVFMAWRRERKVAAATRAKVPELVGADGPALGGGDGRSPATGSSRADGAGRDRGDQLSVDLLAVGWTARSIVELLFLFGLVLGTIYLGWLTASEAAAAGAVASVLILVARKLNEPRLLAPRLMGALRESAALSSMIMLLVVGGGLFSFMLVLAKVPQSFSTWVSGLETNRYILLLLILFGFLVMGCFVDGMTLLLVGVPLTYGAMTGLGFDGIWYGVIVVKMVEIGMITPPVGTNLYVTAGVARGIRAEDVARGVVPFLLVDMLILATFIIFPGTVTWLPNLIKGG